MTCLNLEQDPVDFRAFTTMNIYEDENAYYYPGAFKKDLLRPMNRDYLGAIKCTVKDAIQQICAGQAPAIDESILSAISEGVNSNNEILNTITGVLPQ